MNRATAVAPANIAFTKFWGWRNEALTLPFHDTISMTLSACGSRTTVLEIDAARHASGTGDEIVLLDEAGNEIAPGGAFLARVGAHLDLLRDVAAGPGGPRRGSGGPPLRVVTTNTMPMATGIASSASGFAALTVSAAAVLGIACDEAASSVLARRSGSGSAARSIPGGYVRWRAGTRDDGRDSFAESVHAPDYWALADTIAIVDTAPKVVSSRDGHRAAMTSPHFAARLRDMPERNARVLAALRARDLAALGPVLEMEALDLHRIAETSSAAVRYGSAATDDVLRRVKALRDEGIGAWFTLDAGPSVHVVSRSEEAARVEAALAAVAAVRATRVNLPAPGAHLVTEHLA